MADSILRDCAKTFAKEIIVLCRELRINHVEGLLINQMLRSATSIGANIHEALQASETTMFLTVPREPEEKNQYALIAQSVEHAAVNRGVTGSSPV